MPIIFDLDGTLIDSLIDIAHAANFAMAQLDQTTHPIDAYRTMVGDGADVLMQRALPPDQQHLCDDALQLFKQHYAQHVTDHTTLYAGVAQLLDDLAQRDITLAVLTNKPQRATEQIAAKLLTRWTWAAMHGHRADVPKKPDPRPALAIAQIVGVDSADCVFVGDTSTDMRTAVAAGMIAVGVTWGFRPREELVEHGAHHIIDHPAELLDVLTASTI